MAHLRSSVDSPIASMSSKIVFSTVIFMVSNLQTAFKERWLSFTEKDVLIA